MKSGTVSLPKHSGSNNKDAAIHSLTLTLKLYLTQVLSDVKIYLQDYATKHNDPQIFTEYLIKNLETIQESLMSSQAKPATPGSLTESLKQWLTRN